MRDFLKSRDIKYCEDEPLSRHTSFKIGGPADYFIEPKSADELTAVIKEVRRAGMPAFVMGNGSNLLVSDKGFRGAVIALGERFSSLTAEKDVIKAASGALLSKIGRFALESGLTGFEFACGIPGSLGGAVYMNAGAYGGEMAQVVRKIYFLDRDLNMQEIDGADAGFGYRKSIFKENKLIICGADIALEQGDPAEIEGKMSELARKRRDKQPLEYPSAGSTFKRPEGYFAARLIEDCGLKGLSVGGAEVSVKHAGFVINTGGATCKDVLELMEKIKKTVFDRTGVMLEPEVELLGI